MKHSELVADKLSASGLSWGCSSQINTTGRVQIREPDGAIPGNYASQVVWTGTLAQWNEKVRALNQRAKTLDLGNDGNACLKAIKECEAEQINVVFFSRPFGSRGQRSSDRVFDGAWRDVIDNEGEFREP